jgi:hypothetical protein
VRQRLGLGLDDGQVAPRVGADEPARKVAAIAQAHAQPLLFADYVGIRQKEAIGGKQDAGARALVTALTAAQIDDGRAERLGHAYHGARVGVERFQFLGRWAGRRSPGVRCLVIGNEMLPEARHR